MPQSVRSTARSQAAAFIALVTLIAVGLLASARPAQALDLFAQHEVTVQFATADGKPMADAEVQVYSPEVPDKPSATGHTDSQGKFEFSADINGFWRAEAHVGGEIARVSIKVGGAPTAAEKISPAWLIGGLVLLLALAVGFRVARARMRRRRA